MHCPENINGFEYIELVAAAAIVLSRDLDAWNTFMLAEFLQSLSHQLFIIAYFKDAEEHRKKKPPA